MDDADKANVLVVDDLPEKLLVYESILEDLGQNVVTAKSGAEALKHLLQRSFAVILLDVNMPGMDGLETAALIRKHKRLAHTPIIFITAFLDDVRPLQGYAYGAVDYMLAPVVPEVLRAKVKVFVDLYRMTQQVKRRAEERVAFVEEQAKRAAAEEANRRSAFLAEASATLAKSLDLEATIRGLARLVVPILGDLSAICLVDLQGTPCRMEAACVHVGQGASPQLVSSPLRLPKLVNRAIEGVVATGKSELVPDLRDGLPKECAGGAGVPNGVPGTYLEFELDSALVLPLGARGKTLGTLTLALGPSGRRFHSSDFSLAEDLACRAGIAIDNALLVRSIQETDRRKDEFLAMLAHELRNPLAPIRNAVQVMRLLGSENPELQRLRDLIDRQLVHLTRMVDDLLDVSRITRGKIQLRFERAEIASAVAGAVETSRPLIESRDHELTLSVSSEPIEVMADPARLVQILSNLLNNAAKYTQEKGQISLKARREGNVAVIRVRDNGPGIAPEMLPRVFELFAQGNQALDRSQGGLGIGLTLVRQLVEMHQGTVQAFSDGPGLGSEFVVRLPALIPSPAHNLPATPAASEAVCENARRILVVDDNLDAAESLAMLLRLDGHQVWTAFNGVAAIEAAQAFHPEVVFLDIGLPGMDGYEVARRLREQNKHEEIILAALTGYGQEKDRCLSNQAGFHHHLVKPVEPDALREILVRKCPSAQERAASVP